MPHLTFPTQPDGLVLEAMVGLDGRTISALHQAGRTIAAPIRVRALIDTGTDVSVVVRRVLQALGLSPFRSTTTQTAGGPAVVDLYRVSVGIAGPHGAQGPMLLQPDRIVTDLPAVLPGGIEALIGMDVLAECLLVIDGPGKYFTLAF
jgi:hypothetical protein